MKRSIVLTSHHDKKQLNESAKQQRKRSLEDSGSRIKSKRRRHLSPQNVNSNNEIIPSSTNKKKRSITVKSQTSRKSSSRHQSYSTQHLNEITLPNWERISPNIDQILSNKHTQSGVFAHEVNLVQQELEALLSMSMVRDNLLHSTIDNDNIRLNIQQHQQAEFIYTSKDISNKPSPLLINHHQQQNQRQNGPQLLLDRQVTMTPIIGARIDQIWSDINTYCRKISSNDILTIENLVEFNQQLEEKIEEYKNEYNNNILNQLNIIEQLNEENFQDLLNVTQINPLITHYVDRTTIGRFQTKLYEHIPHTSPVYKTPISSPLYGKLLGNYVDNGSLVRISPRLHPNNRIGQFSLPNFKSSTDNEQLFKKKNSSSPMKLPQRVQLVRDYLTDQHSSNPERVKRQLFNGIKSNKKRKNSLSKILNNSCTDIFQSKLSTLISLLHECSSLSLCALKRARLQSNNEQIWQKLNTIEHDMQLLIQKVDMADDDDDDNHINTEKLFQNLGQLLKDWNKNEDIFNTQYQQLEELE